MPPVTAKGTDVVDGKSMNGAIDLTASPPPKTTPSHHVPVVSAAKRTAVAVLDGTSSARPIDMTGVESPPAKSMHSPSVHESLLSSRKKLSVPSLLCNATAATVKSPMPYPPCPYGDGSDANNKWIEQSLIVQEICESGDLGRVVASNDRTYQFVRRQIGIIDEFHAYSSAKEYDTNSGRVPNSAQVQWFMPYVEKYAQMVNTNKHAPRNKNPKQGTGSRYGRRMAVNYPLFCWCMNRAKEWDRFRPIDVNDRRGKYNASRMRSVAKAVLAETKKIITVADALCIKGFGLSTAQEAVQASMLVKN